MVQKGGRRAIFALGVPSLYGPAHLLKAELAVVAGKGWGKSLQVKAVM